ncbi:MFS transporter [Haloferula helveola]|uniref:MFS transporter n=1 Tax=Haloferula helveola TaxID=490095 RepID=A0ABM7R979_9BACT|nr:MFS transporter [Haloferula helveola]
MADPPSHVRPFWPTARRVNESPPRFSGGRMIAAAFVIGFCSGPGQSFTFSVFQPFLLESFGISRGTFAGIYAAGSLLSAMVASLAGRAADRYGVRRTLALSAVVMAAACGGMALSAGLVSLSVSLAVLRALGQGTLVLLGSLLVMQWYARKRGRAMSLAGLGVSLSGAVLPPACFAAIGAFGWQATYAWIGGILLVALLAVAALLVRNTPEEVGQHPDGDGEPQPVPKRKPDRRVFRSARFWILAIALAAAPFAVTALVFHQASLFADRGISGEAAAGMLSVLAVSAALTTLATGQLVDRFGVRKILRALLVIEMLCLGLAQVLQDGVMLWIYILLLGTVAGSSAVMGGVTWARFYGREGLGAVQGSAGTVMLTAAAIAPLPMGLLRDLTGSHTAGLAICLLLPLAGLLLLMRDVEKMEE